MLSASPEHMRQLPEAAPTDSATKPALSVMGLRHNFLDPDGRTVPVLDQLDIAIEPSEIVAIVGRSGAGKSTLFNIISGLLVPSSGRIEIGAAGDRRGIAYMLQKDLLLPWRNVLDNALLGIELRGNVSAADRDEAFAMLHRYGLAAHVKAFPGALSGGQRQRVALTRTLLLRPAVLLLDEPFSALDFETRLMLEDDVMALSDERGMSVVLVTHDIEEAIAMSDRVIVLVGQPARIGRDIPIELSLSGRRDAIGAREAPEFRDYHARVWRELRAGRVA
jgi:NitT/TauT family transport system ATP-binding protein